ncbi:hypothetical protein DSO57_1023612 [Entomophthora muscae]|uniref:Uncharacterized protein n=1 Tax=Entomophthora muscae TaxID=34485 RepID=A0ACC2UCB1_9FUNG|nr:hypothetical protein DSO57_1023612 [Entomophthora muscae]
MSKLSDSEGTLPFIQAGMVAAPVVLGLLASSPVRKYKHLYYRDVRMPRYQVPNWSFLVIWVTIYIFQGYASFLVYIAGNERGISTAMPFMLYAAQFACNMIWPTFFFFLQDFFTSFYIALVNMILLLIATYNFKQFDLEAGRLMIPYVVWLSFSTFFNHMVYIDNLDNPLLRRHLSKNQQSKTD